MVGYFSLLVVKALWEIHSEEVNSVFCCPRMFSPNAKY